MSTPCLLVTSVNMEPCIKIMQMCVSLKFYRHDAQIQRAEELTLYNSQHIMATQTCTLSQCQTQLNTFCLSCQNISSCNYNKALRSKYKLWGIKMFKHFTYKYVRSFCFCNKNYCIHLCPAMTFKFPTMNVLINANTA